MFAVLGWFDCCGWCVSYAGWLCGFGVGWCCAVVVWIACGMLCFMFVFWFGGAFGWFALSGCLWLIVVAFLVVCGLCVSAWNIGLGELFWFDV